MSEFNKDAIALLNRITANHIYTKMRDVRNGRSKYERSWIWELIQNAKDKAAIDFPSEKVSMLVKLADNKLEFAHNFGYFTHQNVEGLIRQINTGDKDREDVDKTEEPKTTGRFGTGFMTTHLLSEKVIVKGLYKDENNTYRIIKFPLDRSGLEKSELIESVNASFYHAEESLKTPQHISVNFSNFNTIFEYHLDEQGYTIAKTGIEDLTISLPYTLTFIDRIKFIKIIQDSKEIIYSKNEPINIHDNIWYVEIDKTTDGILEKIYYIYLSKNLTRIAVQVQIENGLFRIIPLKKDTPHIFLDFPLIGTDTFYFPVVLNNPFFEPNEPRNGVYLEEQGKESITDQSYFKEALELFCALVNFAEKSNCIDLYNLAKTKLPEKRGNFSQDWFRINIQKPIRSYLLESEIVQTETSRILLRNALIPYNSSESKIENLWHLVKYFHKDRIPKIAHIHEWHKIIDNTWEKDLRYDIKKLVVEIASYNNITNLMLRVELSEFDTLSLMNSIIDFIVIEDEKLLSDYAIIPNQHGDFRKKENLWADENIPKELKDVLKILQEDWRTNLQHKSIFSYEPSTKKGLEDIVNRINSIIKANSISTVKTAVLELLSCFPASNELPNERNELWTFAREFYPNTPDKKNLDNWIKTVAVWEECDKWFMNKLIFDISHYQTITKLTSYLNSDSLIWLDKFVNFVTKQKFESYLNDYAVLPNQNGDFKKIKELSVDEDFDPQNPRPLNDLKDILGLLGHDIRVEMLATEIALNIEGKSLTAKDIANKISERVQQLLREEGLKHRQESTKQVFSKLLLWFHENETRAEKYFADLYDKRHRLRSDDEIIADIKFRNSLLSNPYGYSEEEIINLVNTPKEILYTATQLSEHDIKGLYDNREQFILNEAEKIKKSKKEIQVQEDIISTGITSPEFIAEINRVSKTLFFGNATFSSGAWEYVKEIISRAVKRVLEYLRINPRYKFSDEIGVLMVSTQTPTVITGVYKDGQPINLVIRPSDGQKVHVFYNAEFKALLMENTEFWIENGYDAPELLTIGKILQYTETEIIPLYPNRLR
jgi:hypothetical protein